MTKYYNRDLSWLRFNHRVLQEAADNRNPIGERIRFLAIFSSNLDEFYKVRVSNILKLKQLKKDFRKKLISKPNRLLKLIKEKVGEQQEELWVIFRNSIIPELENIGLKFIEHETFNTKHKDFVRSYFNRIDSQLVVYQGKGGKQFPTFIQNEQLYLVGENLEGELYYIQIPSSLPRFVFLPSENQSVPWLFIDDIISFNLEERYGVKFHSFRVSRDAELYIEDEYSGNLLDKIEEALSNRNEGYVTRALIDANMPGSTIERIKDFAELNDANILKGGKYQNLKDLFQFYESERLVKYKSLPPIEKIELSTYESMFDAVLDKDRIFCYPYESFSHLHQLLKQASVDSSVTKIKATLYRISEDSIIAKQLIEAAKNGKKLFVFIETKARFDEENNIKWGKVLQQHGADVKYSYPGIKVHSKILYIERQINSQTQAISYIATGNLNEKTATFYTDFGLMTAHRKITHEVNQVFDVLQGKIIIPKAKKLLVAPFNARTKFVELVEKEILLAKKGKKAYIVLKMNSLQDFKMINLLYVASNSGVKIKLLIRGICCLVPGIEGQSKNIEVRGIVDRFLEHGRVFIFGNDGMEKMFIGSADWMTRNLDHRIEVITPILDRQVYNKVKKTIELQLKDTVKARIIDVHQSNKYVPNFGERLSSQNKIYNELIK